MASRKRVLDAFARRQPDRCPTFIWLHDDALEPLAGALGVSTWHGLEEELQIDRWRFAEIETARPDGYEEMLWNFVPDEFRDRDDVVIAGEDGRVLHVPEGDDAVGETVLWNPLQALTSLTEFAEYPFPDLCGLEIPPDFATLVKQRQQRDSIVSGAVMQPFTYATHVRGFGNVLSDFIIRPEIVEFIYDRICRFNRMKAEALAEAGVDVLQIAGDIAMEHRLIMSPNLWRRFDKPKLAELIRQVREVKPDICIGIHSDGKLTDIIPDLVEIGIDFLNPVEPECMNPFELKKKWGDRLLIYGGVSHRLLTAGKPGAIRARVRELVDTCGRNGGLIVGPTNAILPETPLENVVALYRAVS